MDEPTIVAPDEASAEHAADAETSAVDTGEPVARAAGPLMVASVSGPEPGVASRYAHWQVRDGAGQLVGGAVFEVSSAPGGSSNWTTPVVVADCTAAGCTGPDLDPDAGEFQIDAAANSNGRYRVTPLPQASGLDFAEGTTISGRDWSTYDFGVFRVQPIGRNATIVVRVGGDRVGTSVSPLAGVTLQLRTSTAAGNAGAPVAQPWSTCESDASGACTFSVPETQTGGANRDQRFWIEGVSAPSGWLLNASLRVGDGTGGTNIASDYRFRTGQELRAGRTYTSGRDFMTATSATDYSDSDGIWQLSRRNPMAVEYCGIDLALVLDFSGSVAGEEDNLVSAAAQLVSALQGTQSRASLYTFSPASPAEAAGANQPTLQPVSTPAQAAAFIDAFAEGTGPDYVSAWDAQGGTNWDAAFRGVAEANTGDNRADAVIFITDGNPTYSLDGTTRVGPGGTNELQQVEAGIASANAVRAQGTRVIAVGVGNGVTNAVNGLNLAAISGPARGSDYFQTAQYSEAAAALRQLALSDCEGTVSVTKLVIPEGGATAEAQPAGGWEFAATTLTPGTETAQPSRVTEAETGVANFGINYAQGVESSEVQIVERQQPGFALEPVGGHNASCIVTGTDIPVTVTDVAEGFRVHVPATAPVSCTVYNRDLEAEASIRVDKQWVIDGAAPVADGHQPAWARATLVLDGSDASWGEEHPGYTAGRTVSLAETVAPLPAWLPGCAIIDQRISAIGGIPASIAIERAPHALTLSGGVNRLTVTNTVECETHLTLVKVVEGGTAQPGEWTLSASSPSGTIAGAAGTASVIAQPIPADVQLTLTEAGGPAVYAPRGGWECAALDTHGEPSRPNGWSDAVDDRVTAVAGMHLRCAVTSVTATLTLLKLVTNDSGGTLSAAAFPLTATPAPGFDGLQGETVDGTTSITGDNTFLVRPDHAYSLSEDMGQYAYLGQSIQQFLGTDTSHEALANPGNWRTLSPSEAAAITVAAGQHEVYRFVNDDAPALTLPLTGGVGADAYLVVGALVLLLSLLVAAAHRTRARVRAHRPSA